MKQQAELYHVGRDPGQTQNVAAMHPEVVKAMTKHYESWHAEARQLFDRDRWITLGSTQAKPRGSVRSGLGRRLLRQPQRTVAIHCTRLLERDR